MFAQRHKRLLPLVGGAIILLFILFDYNQIKSVPLSPPASDHIHEHASPPLGEPSEYLPSVASVTTTKAVVADIISTSSTSSTPSASSSPPKSSSTSSPSSTPSTSNASQATDEASAKEETKGEPGKPFEIEPANREIFSVSTTDKKFFPIKFGHKKGINPNIIPHPHFNDTWIIVAMQHAPSPLKNSVWYAELVCNAVFKNDTLTCLEPPQILPIASTEGHSELCPEDLGWFVFNVGPHDARVFYGPNDPYTIYGSNSGHTCFGQWVQDFRPLMDWGLEFFDQAAFRQATEMQRPKPWNKGGVEKNFFLFWDNSDNATMHAHYDIYPNRVFAEIYYNGTAGSDLAPLAAATDEKCLKAYMPQLAKEQESIHQATNSLQLTLCKRSDKTCTPSNNNTFILTIFQQKKYYDGHSVYYPYVMLFSQSAPFEIYAISKKPLWISGRGVPGGWTKPDTSFITENVPKDQTQMLYVTSMSWKQKGMTYGGYIDDVMFLAFGVEDADTGGIDILAGDLLQDLGICSEL